MKAIRFQHSRPDMKCAAGRQGFTMIELMIAAMIASIVFFAIGTMLVSMHRNFRRNVALLDLNRSAQQVFELCEEGIRSAALTNITAASTSTSLAVTGGGDPFSLSWIDADLIYDSDLSVDGSSALVQGNVESFNISIPSFPPRVVISLALRDANFPELSYSNNYEIKWRNE